MKILFTWMIFQCTICVVCAQHVAKGNYEKEPPLKFQLTINGEKYNVEEGGDLQLKTSISNPKLSIKVFDNKTLENAAVSFEYPRNFSYEFEGDNTYSIWTLSGNSFTIMLCHFNATTALDEYVEGMISNFGKENCKVEKTKKKLGAKTLQGKRLNITVATQKLSMDVLEVNPGKDFLIFQDAKEENGAASAESSRVSKVIDTSIKFKS